jgi:hypothetical protein
VAAFVEDAIGFALLCLVVRAVRMLLGFGEGSPLRGDLVVYVVIFITWQLGRVGIIWARRKAGHRQRDGGSKMGDDRTFPGNTSGPS